MQVGTMSMEADMARVIKNMKGIETYLDNQIKSKAVFRKAGRIVVNEMKKQAPEDEGLLKQSIKVLPSRKAKTSILVGPKFPSKRSSRPTNHPHLVEFGHVAPNGTYVPGTPFIRRAHEATKGEVYNSVVSQLKAAFEKAGKSYRGFI